MSTYTFDHWEDGLGTIISRLNPLDLTIDADIDLFAVYAPYGTICPEGTHWDVNQQACIVDPMPRSGCFIATACLQCTPLEKDIDFLRLLRDRALPLWTVSFYYSISPPIASWIAKNDIRRKIIRGLILPVVKWAKRLYGE